MAIQIDGSCDPRFNRVKDAFAQNFERGVEVGAAVAITIDGKPVVDIWAGHADKARTRPWTRDTLVNCYSTTKGVTAICAHRLAGEGKLDIDAPVAKYWPEFAQAGKAKLPVRYLLSHRAGLAAVSKPLRPDDIYNWDTMCTALAEQEPWWEPGAKHGYHALTFGWLVGEVIRRISGKTPGRFLHDELAGPLGLDLHIGLDAKDDARTADMIPSPPLPPGAPNLFAEIAKNPEGVMAKAFANPPVLSMPGLDNTRGWRGAEIPAANGHFTARGLARLYGALARGGELDGVRVVAQKQIAHCSEEQSLGPDAVIMGISTRFSLGFMMSQPSAAFGPNPKAFGHPGAGGSVGFADPEAKVGFGYTMNQMQMGLLVDPRATALMDAFYASL
ncbi:MAG TPA: serine hydrolase domain-containing protein [Candidatus Binataceae bacterium]|nr:serine hydrolase domain-containing protein [Candidatus Binataceae bacterium]